MPERERRAALLAALRARCELDAGLGVSFPRRDPDLEKLLSAWLDGDGRPAPAASAPPPAPAIRRAAPVPARPAGAESPAPAPPAVRRPAAPPSSLPPAPPETPDNPEKAAALADSRREAAACRGCALCEKRNSVVWGEGGLDSRLMFIGEAPGRDEDLAGRPFVGRSGRLLTDIIEKGLRTPRANVYITNVVKCRPPGNRDPLPDETAACFRYLERQIEAIRPAIIVAVGMVSGRLLLSAPPGTSGLRKRWHEYRGVPLRVIYHPSYLLRQREGVEAGVRTLADRETWNDVLEILARLEGKP